MIMFNLFPQQLILFRNMSKFFTRDVKIKTVLNYQIKQDDFSQQILIYKEAIASLKCQYCPKKSPKFEGGDQNQKQQAQNLFKSCLS